jgi:O-acetylhomoserine (thiol)-lyase
MNPTTDVFEQRVAALEGGTGALGVASGQAAITLRLLAITRLGDEIVAGNNLYGGTYQLFHHTFPKLGRTVKFVDSRKPEAFAAAITEKTRAVYIETIGNPKLDVPDFEAIAAIAHENGIPLVVDNTVGVGLVRRSTTARTSSRARRRNTSAATARRRRRDRGQRQVPMEQRQVPGVHRARSELSRPEVLGCAGQRAGHGQRGVHPQDPRDLLRDIGAALSPFNAHQFLLGLETLPLRQQRHSENALAVARWLKQHPQVSWVTYPGLEGDPSFANAWRST